MDLAPSNVSVNTFSTDWHPQPLVSHFFGISIEADSITKYAENDLLRNALESLGRVVPIRVGGIINDHTFPTPELNETSKMTHSSDPAQPNSNTIVNFYITENWFDTWLPYYHPDTQWIYTLNFAHEENDWGNATLMYNWAQKKLQPYAFEVGNEVDHYIYEGYRTQNEWGISEYIREFNHVVSKLNSSAKWQAAVFADPPEWPDQQNEIDDLSLVNLTSAGFNQSLYSVHMYPQSNCNPERISRLSLELLSNHEVVWSNVSQYIPQVDAVSPGSVVLGETNSASCKGKSGISDTFGTALWLVDYSIAALSVGIERLYYHWGYQNPYSAIQPIMYEMEDENVTAGIRANWYGFQFLTWLGSNTSDAYHIFSVEWCELLRLQWILYCIR